MQPGIARTLLFVCILVTIASCDSTVEPLGEPPALLTPERPLDLPEPSRYEASSDIPAYGPVPTEAQRVWQEVEMIMFVHFGYSTFASASDGWDNAPVRPLRFNPKRFNARQWTRIAKETGFKGLTYTAKHHKGFAMWPTAYSNFSLALSPYKGGKGDIVREVADACREDSIAFGIYLSPWDRYEPTYGTEAYNDFYVKQITELLTGYGPVFEVWLDGAHGTGQSSPYDLKRYQEVIAALQPGAAVGIIGHPPDFRWVGNEDGVASETEWSAREHGVWQPPQCNTPLRPKWFWRRRDEPKSLDHLLRVYFASLGRNCQLTLGIAPTTDGLISEPDEQRLREFRAALDDIFDDNLAAYRPASADNMREGRTGWEASQATDPRQGTFWTTDDSLTTATLEIDLEGMTAFNVIEIQEAIAYGQRVSSHYVEGVRNGRRYRLASGTTIGYRRLYAIDETVAEKVRIVIESAQAAPAISKVGLYHSDMVPNMN